MGFLTSYAVDGSRTPAAVARMQTYAALPNPGVVLPGHCKLVVLGAGTVGLTAGAVVVAAGSSGAAQYQSYVAAVESTDGDAVATIPMPVSTARTLQAVIVVPDPQWAGVPAPADPLTATYAELRILTSAQLASLTTPHYHVATLTIPGSASGLTSAMITDRRRVSRPRRERFLFTHNLVSPNMDYLSGQEAFPDIGGFDVPIPSWATRANISATWTGIVYPAGSTRGGGLWANLTNGVSVPLVRYAAPGAASPSRNTFISAGTIAVPPEIRGTTVYAYPAGNRTSGAGGDIYMDHLSAVVFDIELVETAY